MNHRYCPHDMLIPCDCGLGVCPACERCWNEHRELLEDAGYWNEKLVEADAKAAEEAERRAHERLENSYALVDGALAYRREKRKPETDEHRLSRVLGSILGGTEL
jgi:hypothetical protein